VTAPALALYNVKRHFRRRRGVSEIWSRTAEADIVRAVDGVSLELQPGRIIAIAGESGSGKSTLANIIVGLEKPDTGALLFKGRPVSGENFSEYRRSVQMVFQDPFGSLNPRFTIGRTVEEPLVINSELPADERRRLVREALEEAELKPGSAFIDRYPHELSGGQRQRVAIARAIILRPKVLVADEPVSMLDVSVRASVLHLMTRLVRQKDMALVFITHDLSLIGPVCDDLLVLYKGNIVEQGGALSILKDPQHPYTRQLIGAIPLPDPRSAQQVHQVKATDGHAGAKGGCNYVNRCEIADGQCLRNPPGLTKHRDRQIACHKLVSNP